MFEMAFEENGENESIVFASWAVNKKFVTDILGKFADFANLVSWQSPEKTKSQLTQPDGG